MKAAWACSCLGPDEAARPSRRSLFVSREPSFAIPFQTPRAPYRRCLRPHQPQINPQPQTSDHPLVGSKNMKPRCAFCEREQASNEHVFSRWLSRLLADGAPFSLTKTPGRSTSGLKTINVKSRAPCKACNGGWMSRSESEAKVLLPRMISGEATEWDPPQ
jgi:hypothetical protein